MQGMSPTIGISRFRFLPHIRWLSDPVSYILFLSMDDGRERSTGAPSGCIVFGWAVFLALAVGLGYFGFKVWYYYGIITKGEEIRLPQYRSHLTVSDAGNGGTTMTPEREMLESGANGAGPETGARLTVVEFGDFECPYSKEAHATVRRLMTKYGDSVRFVYRNYPVESIHPDAMLASVAAECAGLQGRFWAYHDKLYLNSPALSFQDLSRYGSEIGLDTTAFEQCLIARDTEGTVEADTEAAVEAGVRGTPTFFLNGYKIEGAIPEEDLDRIIDGFLARNP